MIATEEILNERNELNIISSNIVQKKVQWHKMFVAFQLFFFFFSFLLKIPLVDEAMKHF